MSSSIQRMIVELGGDERPLRLALQRGQREVELFQAAAARTMAKPILAQVGLDVAKVKRDVAAVDDVVRRAYARWNKPIAPTGPSALSMGLMGATGRYGSDNLPPDQINRMRGRGNGIVSDMYGLGNMAKWWNEEQGGGPAGLQAAKTGEQMAKELVGGLRRKFKSDMADAREELFRGLINQQEFEQRGRLAAQAMNKGLLSGIERIGDSGKMTGALHQKLVGELQLTGLAAGDAMAKAMEQRLAERRSTLAATVAGNMRRAMGVATAGGAGGFLSGIGRGNAAYTAMITAGFGLEQMARAKGNVERTAAGIRTALQTTATFAASAFGPQGLLVGALAMGAAAIVEHFAGAKQELRELREQFEKDLAGMIDAGDSAGIIAKIRDIELGKPSAGMGLGGGFKGSIRDLEAQQARDTEAAKAAERNLNILAVGPLKRAIEARAPLIKQLQDQRDQLRDAVLNRPSALADIRGLPAVTVTADSPGKAAANDLTALQQRLADVVQNIAAVRETMSPIRGLSSAVDEVWSEIERRLAAAGDSAGRLATQLRGMRDDLSKAIALPDAIAKAMPSRDRNTFAPPQVTPSGRPPIAPVPMSLASTPKPDFGQFDLIKSTIANTFSSIGDTIGATLMASFGPIAVLMKILEPGIRALEPLFNAFIAPLAAVVEVVAVGLEPVFRLLFPIVKAVAWVFALAQEIISRAVAGLARVVGNVIIAIGKMIDMLPFISGKPIIRAGESILKFSDGLNASADQMNATRKRLEAMEFGQTASDVSQLGDAARDTADALTNVPEFFRLTLQQLRHFGLETVYGANLPNGSAAQAPAGVTIETVRIEVQGAERDPRATARAVVRELETVASAYGMGTAWSSIPSTAV